MNLSTLNYFIQIATVGNLTKAAEQLFISQPTLSRHMKELEQEVGRQLFIRQSHSLKLSNDGQIFLKEAISVLQAVDTLEHVFDSKEAVLNKVEYLRIGYLENFNMQNMYDFLGKYKANNENIQIVLTPDTPANLSKGLENGEYDVIFSLYPYIRQYPNFENKKFIENHLQIALPKNHPLSQHQHLSFSELANETFILLDRNRSPIIVDYVLNKGIENGFNLNANYYVKSLGEGLSMTALGNGLAFLYSAMNQGNLASKFNIKIIDLVDANESQDIHVAINSESSNPEIQNFFKQLTAEYNN